MGVTLSQGKDAARAQEAKHHRSDKTKKHYNSSKFCPTSIDEYQCTDLPTAYAALENVIREFSMKRVLLILLLAEMGCSPDGPSSGRTVFINSCASCHGVNGRGDGPLASALETKPADLTRIAARRDGLWPMVEVMSIIDGYHRRTLPREQMPIFGDLAEGALVPFDAGDGKKIPTPVAIIALANYLETIQDPNATGTMP